MLANLIQDIRYAARTLVGNPVFTLSAVLILAVGIGATTTIFSVVDAVLLRRLPYPSPDKLIVFTEGAHSFPDFNGWSETLGAFDLLAACWDERVDVVGDGAPEQIRAARVTGSFLPLFGAEPYIGRFFSVDELGGKPRVAVLGYGIWRRRWGADPEVVGRVVNIDGGQVTVIGVVAPEFQPPEELVGRRVDVWLPLDVHDPEHAEQTGFHVLSVVGRLADDTSLAAAQDEIDAARRANAQVDPEQYVDRDGNVRIVPLLPLQEATVRRVSATLYLLLGAVGLMLLIACANVANLFLARGTERRREIALRGALGAGRVRIASQLLTESIVVAVAGGVAGAAVAYLGVALFARLNPGNIPRLQDVAVDPRVLAFTFLMSLVTGVLFGSLPALQAARTDVAEMLKEGASSVTTGRRGRRTRGALVVVEIALALVLLAGAGLLFRSLVAMQQVDPGIEVERLVDLSLQLGPTYTEQERTAFVSDLLERLEAMPGTESAAAGWLLPFVEFGGSRCCWRTGIRDQRAGPDAERVITMAEPVTPGYFAMLGARLLRGRELVAADSVADPSVAVLNQALAREVFGSDDVVGRTVLLGGSEDPLPLTVVGVIEGFHQFGLSEEVELTAYVPYERFGGDLPFMHVGVRSTASFDTVVAGMREAVWSLEPDLPIEEIVSMRQRVADSLATPRFLSVLLGVFAGVALLLACGGIYGSMLYSVNQRQREMGIRLALGAGGGSVVKLILGHGILLTALGLGLGVAGALSLSSLMQNLVWGIETTDVPTLAAVTALLAATALSACLVPAVKAARADPLETLRAE